MQLREIRADAKVHRREIVKYLKAQLLRSYTRTQGPRVAAGAYVRPRAFKSATAYAKLMAFRRGLKED